LDGPVSVTADDILQIVPKLSERVDIEEWLINLLKDGPKTKTEVKQAGKPEGFSERQLAKAADRLGIDRKPGGFGKGWLWSLPARRMKRRQPSVECSVRNCQPRVGAAFFKLAAFAGSFCSVFSVLLTQK